MSIRKLKRKFYAKFIYMEGNVWMKSMRHPDFMCSINGRLPGRGA